MNTTADSKQEKTSQATSTDSPFEDYEELTDRINWDSKTKTITVYLGQKDQIPTSKDKNSLKLVPGSRSISGDLFLINKKNPLSKSFVPQGLVSVVGRDGKYLIPAKSSDMKIKKPVMDAANKMFKAAAGEGIKDLLISSAYRSYSTQSVLHTRKVDSLINAYGRQEAVKRASAIVAPPGQSEHQAGIAVDISTKRYLNTKYHLTGAFGKTAEGKWLAKNAWKYGFVVRYLPEKTKVTGIISEPWHLRYVGAPHAEIMYKKNMCLEEYLKYLKKEEHVTYTSSKKKYDIFFMDVQPPAKLLKVSNYSLAGKDVTSYGKYGYVITGKGM